MDLQDLLNYLDKGNLDMFEQASMMHEICTQHHITQGALAKMLHISQSNIGNKIRLLQFDSSEQIQILKYGLSERHARTLLRISPPKRSKLIETVGNMHLTVQQTEDLVEKYTRSSLSDISSPTSTSNHDSVSNYISDIQSGADRLRMLGHKVSILTETHESYRKITLLIKTG